MIPILYEKDETAFASNGLGRLRDIIEAVVTEERNGVYELEFQYPVDGVNYDRIQCGRIVAVEHDESNDVQPFEIVSYSRPINGVVTFHAVHVSYRQCALTVSGTNINSLADAFTLLGNSSPANPFTYWTDKTSTGFLAAGDGVPHSVRSILGGMEGSILDSYGGEYEFDKWTVRLWSSRGQVKPLTIRYGVNLMDYSEDVDYSNTYTACIPYWTGQDANGNDVVVKGSMQQTTYPSFNGTTRCIPLDVTDKFETKPSVAQVEAEGLSYINANQTYLPEQNITVDFIRLSDSPEYEQFRSLQSCKLCDSINVVFPRYNMEGLFKIVRTEYDVLLERYQRMELGALSTSLAEALGISQESSSRALNFDQILTDISTLKYDYVVAEGSSGNWRYRKWKSGKIEAWGTWSGSVACTTASQPYGGYRSASITAATIPSGIFTTTPKYVVATKNGSNAFRLMNFTATSATATQFYISCASSETNTVSLSIYAMQV